MPTSLAWHRGRAGKTRQPPAGSWVFTWQTEAEGRLWGVGGADALVPAACLALMPPAARRWCIRARLPPARCVHRVWVEGCTLSPRCWGSSPRELQHLVSRLAGKRGQPPAPSPAPASSHCPCLAWPLAGSIGPLTHCQHSPPANFAPSLIPLTSSPCAKPCAGENRSCEKGPAAPWLRPPHPPALPLTSWGTSPKLLRCSGLFLFGCTAR